MWIRRLINQYLSALGLYLTAKLAPPEQLEKQLALASAYVLDAKLFEPMNRRLSYSFVFSSSYANILALINVLDKACLALANEQKFDVTLLPPDQREMCMDEFFIDERMRYVVASSAVNLFREQAIAFLDLYYAIDVNAPGIPQFNHRVLSKLVRSTTETARALKAFSHEKRPDVQPQDE